MRRAKYLDKKHLYSQIACLGRTATINGTITAGTVYKLPSNNTTIKFDQEQNQKTLLQDGNEFLTLGTIQKGKTRHKLLMDKQPAGNAGTGVKVAALGISGFHTKKEKPKQILRMNSNQIEAQP